MGAVDFSEWVAPDLVIPLGERTYRVAPPSVADARMILAAAVRGEVRLGIVKGEIPDDLRATLDSIGGHHPALGDDVYQQMVDDGIASATIDRVAYYAVFYWARGKEYADKLAEILWSPRDITATGGGANPKGW